MASEFEPIDAVVARAREHDPAAWRQLYDEHFDFVHAVACKLGTPRDEVEDVVQEVFLVVFRKLTDFQGGRLNTWIFRICANIVSDRHRRRRVREALLGLLPWVPRSPPPSPEEVAQRGSAQELVRRVLGRMSAKKREVLALYEIEGFSVAEIAQLVGCPQPTVRTRLFHARRDFLRVARRCGALEPEVES